MSTNVIGVIVYCVAMVISVMGFYFIGRLHGIEWAVEHMQIDISRLDIHRATPEETEELFQAMAKAREKDNDKE